MIERTFVHLPGAGYRTEQRLWERGIENWQTLRDSLRGGSSVGELLGRQRQRRLFATADRRSDAWLSCLDASEQALATEEFAYILDRLRPMDHWRLLPDVMQRALYLDIETTGLSRDHHYMTVVGALFDGRFHQWVWPEPLEDLAEMVREASCVVTFNGTRFDLPFIRGHLPAFPAPRAHIDLLYPARAAGLTGGQKEVERQLGLPRADELTDMDGPEAIRAWCEALYGRRKSYSKLLRYNRADVENMPLLAARISEALSARCSMRCVATQRAAGRRRLGHRPLSFESLQQAWTAQRPNLSRIADRLVARFGRQPVVVGIDLRAKEIRPTGWAVCIGEHTETAILYDDEAILERTLAAKPDLVSIDAPLSLPRGRQSVSDDSPCRKSGGIVRDAERQLWARGIRVYPALIRQMQGLTSRGIELTCKLRSHGIEVIESYPGAAQDVLNIPRKKTDELLLRHGLAQFGYRIGGSPTHDELDAITSALVGQFFLADVYEAIGARDEGHMILPFWKRTSWSSCVPARSARQRRTGAI